MYVKCIYIYYNVQIFTNIPNTFIHSKIWKTTIREFLPQQKERNYSFISSLPQQKHPVSTSHGCKKCELGEPSSVHIGNFSCTFTYC